MIKIRLHGTLEEIEETTEIIGEQFRVINESEPYADRGKSEYYRCYLDCELVEKRKKRYRGKVLELESERLMRIGREEGRAEALAEAREEARKKGERLLAALSTKLFNEGRIDDVKLAAKDKDARKRFYKEFGLGDFEDV